MNYREENLFLWKVFRFLFDNTVTRLLQFYMPIIIMIKDTKVIWTAKAISPYSTFGTSGDSAESTKLVP